MSTIWKFFVDIDDSYTATGDGTTTSPLNWSQYQSQSNTWVDASDSVIFYLKGKRTLVRAEGGTASNLIPVNQHGVLKKIVITKWDIGQDSNQDPWRIILVQESSANVILDCIWNNDFTVDNIIIEHGMIQNDVNGDYASECEIYFGQLDALGNLTYNNTTQIIISNMFYDLKQLLSTNALNFYSRDVRVYNSTINAKRVFFRSVSPFRRTYYFTSVNSIFSVDEIVLGQLVDVLLTLEQCVLLKTFSEYFYNYDYDYMNQIYSFNSGESTVDVSYSVLGLTYSFSDLNSNFISSLGLISDIDFNNISTLEPWVYCRNSYYVTYISSIMTGVSASSGWIISDFEYDDYVDDTADPQRILSTCWNGSRDGIGFMYFEKPLGMGLETANIIYKNDVVIFYLTGTDLFTENNIKNTIITEQLNNYAYVTNMSETLSLEYSDAGNDYSAVCSYTSMNGWSNYSTDIIYFDVLELPPRFEIGLPGTYGVQFVPLQFGAVVSEDSGPIDSWEWLFGDGSYSYEQNPSKTYTYPSTFNIQVQATGSGGTTIKNTSFLILPYPPELSITATPTEGLRPLTIDYRFYNTGGEILSFAWLFGNGDVSTYIEGQYTYTATGVYTLLLNANGAGGDASVSQTITVNEPAPNISILKDKIIGYAPLDVSFSAINTGGEVSAYYWDFGDGNTSAAQNVTHTYETDNNYTVYVSAVGAGGISTASTTLRVKPIVELELILLDSTYNYVDPAITNIKITEQYYFSALASGTYSAAYLNFGDKSYYYTHSAIPTSAIPHVYNAFETVLVTLSAYSISESSAFNSTLTLNIAQPYYYVDINSTYSATGSGTSASPYNWDQFTSRVQVGGAGKYMDAYCLKGYRNLVKPSSVTTYPWVAFKTDKDKKFEIRDWDCYNNGPWIISIEDYSDNDENGILSFIGCTLKNGIIYNKPYGYYSTGGKLVITNTYDMYIVNQGRYSKFEFDSYNNMLIEISAYNPLSGGLSAIVPTPLSQIVGSTIYSNNGYIDSYDGAFKEGKEYDIIDSVIFNFSANSLPDFTSASHLYLYNTSFNVSAGNIYSSFHIHSAVNCQFYWIPPSSIPFTVSNSLYNKDLTYVINNRRKLKPFQNISNPPNPGRGSPNYTNYSTGLFGYSRSAYRPTGVFVG